MSTKKALKILAIALAPHLPVLGTMFGIIVGVTLMVISVYFYNVTMFFVSIIITSVLPPVLEAVGGKIKEKYEAMQNEVDIIAMIPEWLLGYEMLLSIAIMILSIVLKNSIIFYLGAWLLCLGNSLGMAKEIIELKEDLRSPDLEKRRAAVEVVESDKQIATMSSLFLLFVDILILSFTLLNEAFRPTVFVQVVVAITIVLIPVSFIPCCIVYTRADKLMPPEPEKAARAAS